MLVGDLNFPEGIEDVLFRVGKVSFETKTTEEVVDTEGSLGDADCPSRGYEVKIRL